MTSPARWSPVSDDLYIGPTLLAPGPKQPRVSGERLAKILILPLLALFAVIVLVFFVFFQAGSHRRPVDAADAALGATAF